MVVSNIFYFHPYLGKISNLTNIFQMGLKPPTSNDVRFSLPCPPFAKVTCQEFCAACSTNEPVQLGTLVKIFDKEPVGFFGGEVSSMDGTWERFGANMAFEVSSVLFETLK